MIVSVIIINYNTKDLIRICIDSILKWTKNINYEIIVVDNASKDDSVDFIQKNYPFILLIKSSTNLGFGKANNLATKYAKGKYYFFLNPDCQLIENSVLNFYNYLENNSNFKIGSVGAMLIDNNKTIVNSYFSFPSLFYQFNILISICIRKIFKINYKLSANSNYKILNYNNEVDFISGANLFMPNYVFNLLNGFDERFFMYFEETDLQLRMSHLGFKRIILTKNQIIHIEGSSFSQKNSLNKLILYRDSMFKYYKKHYNIFLYIFFYVITTPLLLFPVFQNKYILEERLRYIKVLLRKQ